MYQKQKIRKEIAVTLDAHPFFEKWRDPESGVESYVLTERVAPMQQSFYFDIPGVSQDEKWLWFYAAFPPSPFRTLAVVSLDPDEPLIRHFPEASFSSFSPMVAPEGDAAYFCMGASVWRQPIEGKPEAVCTLSEDYIGNRPLCRLAATLTLSADGGYFLLDGAFGGDTNRNAGHISNLWFVGLGDTKTGEVEIIREFPTHYHHAQFSPTRNDLFVIGPGFWSNPISGKRFRRDYPMFLMDTEGSIVDFIIPPKRTHGHHHWWGPEGKYVYWVNLHEEVYAYDVSRREASIIWDSPICHAHCGSEGRYFCGDASPYRWEQTGCQLKFYDRKRDQEINVISKQPYPNVDRRPYNLDPHPQFSPRDTWITHTTTVRGEVDVALTPVAGILDSF